MDCEDEVEGEVWGVRSRVRVSSCPPSKFPTEFSIQSNGWRGFRLAAQKRRRRRLGLKPEERKERHATKVCTPRFPFPSSAPLPLSFSSGWASSPSAQLTLTLF